jgi:hypothetical protein
MDWIPEAWQVYELLKEQPLTFVELLVASAKHSCEDHVVQHNKLIHYVGILMGMGMVTMPKPVGWDKPYTTVDIEGNPVVWEGGIPRGHWKMYVAAQMDKRQFYKKCKRTFW